MESERPRLRSQLPISAVCGGQATSPVGIPAPSSVKWAQYQSREVLGRNGQAGGRKRETEGDTRFWKLMFLSSEGLWASATGRLGTHHYCSPHLSCYVQAQRSGTLLPLDCIPVSPDQPSNPGCPSVVTQNVSDRLLVWPTSGQLSQEAWGGFCTLGFKMTLSSFRCL